MSLTAHQGNTVAVGGDVPSKGSGSCHRDQHLDMGWHLWSSAPTSGLHMTTGKHMSKLQFESPLPLL